MASSLPIGSRMSRCTDRQESTAAMMITSSSSAARKVIAIEQERNCPLISEITPISMKIYSCRTVWSRSDTLRISRRICSLEYMTEWR